MGGLVSTPADAIFGSHASQLKELRLGAQLNAELRKPRGERDEERLHRLRVDYRQQQLGNAKSFVEHYARQASSFEEKPFCGTPRICCPAATWVRQRMAASYRARHAFACQEFQQVGEELDAVYGRRKATLVVLPTFDLHLPEALQQPPPRFDMCSTCAKLFDQAELDEQRLMGEAQQLVKHYQNRGLEQATAGAAASGGRVDAGAAAAPQLVGKAQQQRQEGCSSDGADVGGNEASTPRTPMQSPPMPQQQHHSSPKAVQERQEQSAAYELLGEQQPVPPVPPLPQQQQQCASAAAGEQRAAMVLYS